MTITLTREEAQQLLDAWDAYDQQDLLDKAIETLRDRLAQPEPEPVAWFMEGTFMDGSPSFIQVCETDPEFYTPLYRAPQREWQGLTDEEKKTIYEKADAENWHDQPLLEAVEAKLKEKNT
jgi:hypothetical protein